jgi:hypothetical protein
MVLTRLGIHGDYASLPGDAVNRIGYTTIMDALLVLFAVSGLGLMALSIPLLRNKVKPNGLYGFRIKATLEDPRLWYEVNQYFAKRLLVTGMAVLISSLLLYLIPDISVDAYAWGVLFVFCLFFIPGIVASVRYLHRLENS